jgi:two-component system response regulator AtoC
MGGVLGISWSVNDFRHGSHATPSREQRCDYAAPALMSTSPSVLATDAPDARPLLYVDDEPENLELFRMQFGRDFPVLTAKSGAEALELLGRREIALLLTDERMPGMCGVELLSRVLERWPDVVRIIVSAYTDATRVLLAINRGHAYEYVVKPWDRSELRGCIERGLAAAARRRDLLARAERSDVLERDLSDAEGRGDVITQDEALQTVLASAEKAAQTEASVLITGETGTGKELVAHLIHQASPRAHGPFVRLNCAALSEGVLESELFGHEQGAFTGASKMRRGRFELASGGTLFLDEIGDISPKLQVNLLRVLQEKEIERVGGSTTIRVNARIVSATHRSLPRLVREGRFREDLYYRLNVVPIEVPPLRARPGDVGLLVRRFVEKHASRSFPPPAISPKLVDHLASYSWPGNVRELENMVQRALALSSGPELTLDDFRFNLTFEDEGPPPFEGTPAFEDRPPREEARQAEREELRRLLVVHGGNVARAARSVGLARTTLLSRAKKHGLLV